MLIFYMVLVKSTVKTRSVQNMYFAMFLRTWLRSMWHLCFVDMMRERDATDNVQTNNAEQTIEIRLTVQREYSHVYEIYVYLRNYIWI